MVVVQIWFVYDDLQLGELGVVLLRLAKPAFQDRGEGLRVV